MPLQGWNGRFQGIGGGGYAAGTLSDAAPQTALGYSTGATDAGHDTSSDAVDDASPWALLSEGNVEQNLLLNFARRSLHDMTIIGKAISKEFYGKTVDFSYWNGEFITYGMKATMINKSYDVQVAAPAVAKG